MAESHKLRTAVEPNEEEPLMKLTVRAQCVSAALAMCLLAAAHAQEHHYLLNGLDDKVSFDESGKPVFTAPGRDLVNIMEIGADRRNRRSSRICRSPIPSSGRR